ITAIVEVCTAKVRIARGRVGLFRQGGNLTTFLSLAFPSVWTMAPRNELPYRDHGVTLPSILTPGQLAHCSRLGWRGRRAPAVRVSRRAPRANCRRSARRRLPRSGGDGRDRPAGTMARVRAPARRRGESGLPEALAGRVRLSNPRW